MSATRCGDAASAGWTLPYPVAVLWRDNGVLQVGADGPILHGVPPQSAALVRALERPWTPAGLARECGLEPRWVTWLVTELTVAGVLRPPPSATISVVGDGPLAWDVATALLAEDPVHLEPAAPAEPDPTAPDGDEPPAPPGTLYPEPVRTGDPHASSRRLAILAVDTCQPDRTTTDGLLRRGGPFLIVRLDSGRGVVGPLVLPGRTACIRCDDLQRARADPAWPRLLAQLVRARGGASALTRRWTVATACLQARAFVEGAVPDTVGHSLELDTDGLVRVREPRPHPECGCQGRTREGRLGTMAACPMTPSPP